MIHRKPRSGSNLVRISGTIDWNEARVSDPIEVLTTGSIVNTCYNINGQNPDYTLDDPNGFCSLIERNPTTGSIVRVYNRYDNLDKLVIRGVDVSLRWNAAMTDMGLAYNWGAGHRVAVTWQYRLGTHTATTFRATPSVDGQFMPVIQNNPILAGYPTSNQFNGTFGTRIGRVNASVSVNNLLNSKPRTGGYDLRDPRQGFGSFSPFDDLVGRRYSINLTADF